MNDAPRIPLFPLTRFWWTLAFRAKRNRAPILAVLAALVMIAGIGVVATRAPSPGCKWKVVATAGREHLVCGRPS